jgi:hypothetical protein
LESVLSQLKHQALPQFALQPGTRLIDVIVAAGGGGGGSGSSNTGAGGGGGIRYLQSFSVCGSTALGPVPAVGGGGAGSTGGSAGSNGTDTTFILLGTTYTATGGGGGGWAFSFTNSWSRKNRWIRRR